MTVFSPPLKRVLRVGMATSQPWLYAKPDYREGAPVEEIYSGYSFDLLNKLKNRLNIEFEIINSNANISGLTIEFKGLAYLMRDLRA